MTFAVFIWFMCGIGSAIVAVNKGRSGFGWFLLGFLFSPIGFILSLVVGKNVAVLEANAILSGELRKCPYCAELVKVEAKICKHCGKELPLDVEQNHFTETTQSNNKEIILKKSLSTKEIFEHGGQFIAYGKVFSSRSEASAYITECNKY